MIRTLLIGLVLFLAFAVAFAPASLMRTVLPERSGADLLETSGTVWHGSADLYLAGQPAGRLSWTFAPDAVVRGALGYRIHLAGPEDDLSGIVDLGAGGAAATWHGRATAAFANRWLGAYDIAISGDLTFEDAHLQVPYDYARSGKGAGSGNLNWTGGPVRYRLGSRAYSGNLPPLVAYLGDGLEAVVYPQGGQTPLLRVEMLPNGFVRIGVTQLLTDLAGNPWPGSHADHEVVLEVEEQLF